MVMDKKRESVRNEERVFIARRKIGVDMEEAQQLVLAEDDFTHYYYNSYLFEPKEDQMP